MADPLDVRCWATLTAAIIVFGDDPTPKQEEEIDVDSVIDTAKRIDLVVETAKHLETFIKTGE